MDKFYFYVWLFCNLAIWPILLRKKNGQMAKQPNSQTVKHSSNGQKITSLSLIQSLTHLLTHSHTDSFSLSLSLCLAPPLDLSTCLSLSPSVSLSFSLSVSLSLSLSQYRQ